MRGEDEIIKEARKKEERANESNDRKSGRGMNRRGNEILGNVT